MNTAIGISVAAIVAVVTIAIAGTADRQDVTRELEALVNGIVDADGEDPIHNAVVLVEAPGFKWKGAAGMADGQDERMTADHKFKIASIGKTFTATVVLQMVEEGVLGLDDTLGYHLDPADIDLHALHVYEEIAYGRQITIGHLLNHTSGIRDYMGDPRFIPFVVEHPDTQWSPSLIFEKYFEWGVNRQAAFPPGEDFEYSDPNYVLLAMVIERVTDSTLAAQYRARIFDRLGMSNSYLEFYEEPRGSMPLSHAFFGTMDVSASVNTSFDWGGGGIVSTCEELNTFFRALLEGRLFEKKSTLDRMLAEADKGRGGEEYDYGLGIMKRSIGGFAFYGHGGAYDCDVFYSPEAGVSACTALNQMETHGKRDPFLERAVSLALSASGERP
ncbi:MAG: hypothetical protein AMS21_07755 [Gemmatimonas sp. SG8_38_2]|nr:MAG: hypothetical protein AMS21_07755 [Gemmatimonas sp. SG8_38_2]